MLALMVVYKAKYTYEGWKENGPRGTIYEGLLGLHDGFRYLEQLQAHDVDLDSEPNLCEIRTGKWLISSIVLNCKVDTWYFKLLNYSPGKNIISHE